MLRPAIATDLPALLAIRDGAGDDALSDPVLVSAADLCRLTAAAAVTVSEEAGAVVGFAAIDGDWIHLLVDPARRGRGVGRDLLAAACAAIAAAGHGAATIAIPLTGSAERHYRAAGWRVVGQGPTGGTILKKPI